jgi:hypothetical protein
VLAEEIEESFGLTGPGAKVDVGQEQGANPWHAATIEVPF